jgi:hypothetical protein
MKPMMPTNEPARARLSAEGQDVIAEGQGRPREGAMGPVNRGEGARLFPQWSG